MSNDIHITQVTPATLLAALRVCIRARVPAFTWGKPGIGKSDLHRQLTADLVSANVASGAKLSGSRIVYTAADGRRSLLIDVRASQWDAVDTRGVPFVDGSTRGDGMVRASDATTRWAVPSVFPSDDEAAKYDVVVLFLDELNAAAPSVQAALYQLILDGALGEYVLPANVVILAAGNRETDRAVTHRMSSALAGRFVHYELNVDAAAWERWALGAGVHIAVISYMRYRPDNLHAWDAKSASKAQPTPRTHEFLSKLILEAERAGGVPANVEHALACSAVGEAVGTEFAGFLRTYRGLTDPDAVILAPDSAPISDEVSVNYAMCGALAERATDGNIGRILRYAERMRDDRRAGPEFMTLLVRSATLRHPEVQNTMAFIKWAADDRNADVLR